MIQRSDQLAKKHKYIIALLTTLLLGCLVGCDRGQFDRSGIYSPRSFDPTPLRVTIGKTHFLLPKNCLDSPLGAGIKQNEFVPIDGALFAALLPDISCRTKSNNQRFRITGEYRPEISWTVQKIGNETQGYSVLKRHFEFLSVGEPNYINGSFIRRGSGSTQIVSIGLKDVVMERTSTRDLFGDPSLGSFVYCSRSLPRRRADAPPTIGNCNHEFLYGGLIVKAFYGRGWLLKRKDIESHVALKMNDFKLGGE